MTKQPASEKLHIRLGSTASVTLTLEETLFFAFFCLLSVTKGLGFYEGQKVFEVLTFLALLFGAAKVLLTPYTKGEWIRQAVLLFLMAVTFFQSGERGILFLGFLVLGMKNISVRKVFHAGLWIWSLCAIALSLVSFFRLEHTIYRVHDKLGMGHIFRWSLGFTHPNILHITYLALCALILYELGERYRIRHFLLLMLGNAAVFLYSVSYTGMIIVTVLLLGGLYVRFRPRFCILEKLAANLILPACVCMSFVFPRMMFGTKYAGPLQQLNQLLNTRLYLAWQFLQPEYIRLFGTDVSEVVQSSMTMDNSYVWGLVNYGVVTFCVILAGYFLLSLNASYRQRTRELVILVCFFGAGWTEPLLFNTSFKNLTLIFLGAFLFGQCEGNAGGRVRKKKERREYMLFPGLSGAVAEIPYAGLPDDLAGQLRSSSREEKRRLLCLAAAGIAAGLLLCHFCYRQPEGYVVPRFYTDGLEETSVFLRSEDDPDYEGYVVMNYVDADTPMQLVTGEAVTLETVRYYAGSALIGGFLGALAGGAWQCAQRRTGKGTKKTGREMPDGK